MKAVAYLSQCFVAVGWAISPLSGFQVPDSLHAADGGGEKFIFYWGNIEVALRADEAYRAEVTLSPAAFQQMLLHPPRLWNGRTLEEKVAFRLEDFSVVATRGTTDYEAQLAELYEHLAPKADERGRFQLTDLVLPTRQVGTIVFLIKHSEGHSEEAPFSPDRYPHFHFDSLRLSAVSWGLNHLEVTHRDFFTAREAFQIVQQQPSIVWQPYVRPQPAHAEVQVIKNGVAQQTFRVDATDANVYARFTQYLCFYRFLFRPGHDVVLRLFSDSYDHLFEHRLRLVDEQDPRLALRRYRDTHRVRLVWGPVRYVWNALYLSCQSIDDTTCLGNDPAEQISFTLGQALLPQLLTTRPILWIDDVRVPDLSFKIAVDNREVEVLPQEAMPALDLFASEEQPLRRVVRLHQLAAAGYDLSSIALNINVVTAKVQIAPLLTVAFLPALVLYQPSVQADTVEITFDLPDVAIVKFTVSNSAGNVVHRIDSLYSAGRHHISLSREIFAPPGSYTVELVTPFGAVWQTFEIL